MSPDIATALVAGLLAGYGIAVPIGPVGAYLVQVAARSPWRTGVAAALGVATTDALYALVAVLGGSAVAGLLAPVLPALRWAAATALAVLAIRTALTGLRTDDAVPVAAPAVAGRTFLTLLGLTAVNPATVIYFVALVVGLPAVTAGPPAAVFVTAAFAASASWQVLVAGSGMVLGRVASSPRGRRATALGSAVVVLALAGYVAWGG